MVKTLYTRSYIKLLPSTTPVAQGLQLALEGWQGLPQVGLRENMAVISAVGGQGHVHCTCKGKCKSKHCSCFKADRKCNSRCHARAASSAAILTSSLAIDSHGALCVPTPQGAAVQALRVPSIAS